MCFADLTGLDKVLAGRFVAEGLAPGIWLIEMATDERPTIYRIEVPTGTQGLLQAGVLTPIGYAHESRLQASVPAPDPERRLKRGGRSKTSRPPCGGTVGWGCFRVPRINRRPEPDRVGLNQADAI
jgi:hypothetical protein